MNTTYGWLYQHYAHPLLEKQRQKAREELEALDVYKRQVMA